MKLYRFSPITNKAQLAEAVAYIAEQVSELCRKAIGQQLPITYLTVFTHYEDEYQTLVNLLAELGETSTANNGLHTKLTKPIVAKGQMITNLRVRKPDPYRMQVGCCDLGVDDFEAFKQANLGQHTQNLRLIERSEYDMIEFFDPDYDVLAYAVGEEKT